MGFFDDLKKAAKDAAKEVGDKAKKGIDGAKKMYDENKPPSEEEKKELEPRIQRALKNGGDFDNLMYEMNVLEQKIDVILSMSVHKRGVEPKKPEGFWADSDACDILGFEDDKDKNYILNIDDEINENDKFYLSYKAITTAVYMGYELDSIAKVTAVVNNKQLLIDTFNIIHHRVDGWEAVMDYMKNHPYPECKEELNKAIDQKKEEDELEAQRLKKEAEEIAAKEAAEEKERIEREARERKEQEIEVIEHYNKTPVGGILLTGIYRHIIFQGDKIELNAVEEDGLMGMINETERVPDQDFYIEDVRGVTVHLGKNPVLNALTSKSEYQKMSEVRSYIRFELKGENVQVMNPHLHPYTVIVSSENIGHAHGFKLWFDGKISEIRKESKSNSSSNGPSSADELLKFSELLEKGLITKDEFEAQKKKILGL